MIDPQQFIEQDVRFALGDLTLQLIIARANQRALEGEVEQLKKQTAKPPENGKEGSHAEANRPQPD